jgi:hypothetical protein
MTWRGFAASIQAAPGVSQEKLVDAGAIPDPNKDAERDERELIKSQLNERTETTANSVPSSGATAPTAAAAPFSVLPAKPWHGTSASVGAPPRSTTVDPATLYGSIDPNAVLAEYQGRRWWLRGLLWFAILLGIPLALLESSSENILADLVWFVYVLIYPKYC